MATSSFAKRPPAPPPAAPPVTSAESDTRPSYLAAGIVTLAVLGLYIATLAPSTAMWDTSEYIAAAYTLGLPHPPGNPMFVLLGRVFAMLPIFGPTVAIRINVLAAICSAVSAGMWFLITERVLVGWFPQRWQRITGGVLAALIGASAFTVWNQSVVNEKVYTVSLVGIAIISWLMIRWSDDPDGKKADRILVLVAYILGLGYANHMGGMLAAPAAAVAVLVRRPQTLLRWRLLLACFGALVLGITPFATQPIRAAYNPPINEGEPTACRAGLKLSCTFSQGTIDAFMYNFNRGQYGKPALSDRQAPFIEGQIGMWWFYFRWQWFRDAQMKTQWLQGIFAGLFLVLGLFGGWVHFQRDRRSFWYFGTFMFTVTLLLIYYLNFRYGASQSPELGDTVNREVRDRDYFFLWSFSAWGVWAALGLMYIWENLAALFGSEDVRVGKQTLSLPQRTNLLKTSPVLAIALIPLIFNAGTAPRRGQTYTRDFAHDLLNSVEPYGILVTVGDNDTFPLWYAQEVEGIRKDVVVANTSLLNTDWYTRQLIRRPIYEYDAAKGPAIYRDKQWVKPTAPPLKMSLDAADSVPPYWQVDRPMIFRFADTATVIQPHLLQRADMFVLRMIQDGFPSRPIYFSRTSGTYSRELGLNNFTLTQGLAAKVFIPPKVPGKDTVAVASDGFLDLRRTQTLWNDVFLGPKSVIRAGDWIDKPSVGIPFLYVATGMELAEVLRSRGELQEASSVYRTARKVADVVHLEGLVSQEDPGLQPPPTLVPSETAGVQLKVQPPPAQKAQEPPKPKP
jgi:hypothetical protein